MNQTILFTDGSVNVSTRVGYGAYLFTTNLDSSNLELVKSSIHLKRFDSTSSTKLELETLLWALSDAIPEINELSNELKIYTDSQNIISLPGRRSILEQNDYYTKNNKRLTNYLLYKKFYDLSDRLNFEVIKVKGHKSFGQKNTADQYFALVDRAARRAMKKNQISG